MEVTAIPRSINHDVEESHVATRRRRGEASDPDPGGGADRARAPLGWPAAVHRAGGNSGRRQEPLLDEGKMGTAGKTRRQRQSDILV